MKPYYKDKSVKLYLGDWREASPLIQTDSVGLILTDPPYGTTALEWDKPVDWPAYWAEAERLTLATTPKVLFASGSFTNKLFNSNAKQFRYELIWEKSIAVGFLDANRRPLRAHENILVFIERMKDSCYNPQMIEGKVHSRGSKGSRASHYGTHRAGEGGVSNLYFPRSVLRFSSPRAARSVHPTQKPLELIEWLVNTYSREGDLVVDHFCGSGTTLVAAKKLGRRAVGIDSSERFCEVTANRLRSQEGVK